MRISIVFIKQKVIINIGLKVFSTLLAMGGGVAVWLLSLSWGRSQSLSWHMNELALTLAIRTNRGETKERLN